MLLPFAILTQTCFTTRDVLSSYHLHSGATFYHKAYPACIACSSAILVTPQLVQRIFLIFSREQMGTPMWTPWFHDPKFFRTNSNFHPISNKSGSLLEAFWKPSESFWLNISLQRSRTSLWLQSAVREVHVSRFWPKESPTPHRFRTSAPFPAVPGFQRSHDGHDGRFVVTEVWRFPIQFPPKGRKTHHGRFLLKPSTKSLTSALTIRVSLRSMILLEISWDTRNIFQGQWYVGKELNGIWSRLCLHIRHLFHSKHMRTCKKQTCILKR